MRGFQLAGCGLAAALFLVALGGPTAAADPRLELAQAGSSDILGTWYRTTRPGGVRLEDDGVVSFLGNEEWPNNAQTCTAAFEHELRTLDNAALFTELTQDDVYDENGDPIAVGLEGRLPEGNLTVLRNYCYGAAETSSAVYYILVAPTRLTAVAFGDGAYDIEDLQREPPLVPAQSLDQETREQVQQALLARGLYEDEIDGMFGPGTRAAISAYQATLGAEETGVLNRHQLDILLGN
jgi:hypothetical protein